MAPLLRKHWPVNPQMVPPGLSPAWNQSAGRPCHKHAANLLKTHNTHPGTDILRYALYIHTQAQPPKCFKSTEHFVNMGAHSREHSLSTKATNPAPRRASSLDSPAPHLRADPPSSGLPSLLLATANSSCSCQATGEPVSPSEARLTRGGQTQTPISGGQAGQGHWEAWPLGPKPVLVVSVPVTPSFQVFFLEPSDPCIQCSWLLPPCLHGGPRATGKKPLFAPPVTYHFWGSKPHRTISSPASP